MPFGTLLIGQDALTTDHSGRLFADILPWLLVLVGVVIVGTVVIYFVRRSIQNEAGTSAGGFTLQDLRELHAAGELSDDEYQRARAAMIGRVKAQPNASRTHSHHRPRDDDARPNNQPPDGA
jgi:hypothetical protein